MPNSDRSTDERLEQALEALDNDAPDEALMLLEGLLTEQPDNVDAIVLKAEAYVVSDRWEEAEELLEESAHVYNDEPALLFAFAEIIVDFHPDDLAAVEQALEVAQRGEKLAKQQGEDELITQLLLVQGRAHNALGNLTESVEAYQRAHRNSGDDEILVELSMAQFEACRFDEARASFEKLAATRPDDARVHHYLGLIHERGGRAVEAEREFARARELDPEEFPVPQSMSEDDFLKAVEEAYERLPEKIRLYLTNVPVMIDPIPSDDDVRGDPPLSPLSLGMFRGLPVGETSILDPWSLMPSSILLFQKNLERYARSKEELLEEIETTLLHEVGHFVGWDEEDLFERNLH
jgi:predicted Zn-dependent protease with MMP-like domain/Flp pilus assembly protein TadD